MAYKVKKLILYEVIIHKFICCIDFKITFFFLAWRMLDPEFLYETKSANDDTFYGIIIE